MLRAIISVLNMVSVLDGWAGSSWDFSLPLSRGTLGPLCSAASPMTTGRSRGSPLALSA